MKTGTKSLLFGVHAFWWHPITVAIAWIGLYGFQFDPRIWVAFFVHDLGYWGKPNMDGPEGRTHPETGAKIMHFLFDKWKMEVEITDTVSLPYINRMLSMNYRIAHITATKITFTRYRKDTRWHNFVLLHSRHYAADKVLFPSMLCFADKLAVCYDPMWFYLLRATLSGEIREYMRITNHVSKREWAKAYRKQVKEYVNHKT